MAAARSSPSVELDVDGFDVRLTNPDRVYFSVRGETKLDLAKYYLSVGPGIVNALRERPCMLHRFPKGVDGQRAPSRRHIVRTATPLYAPAARSSRARSASSKAYSRTLACSPSDPASRSSSSPS